MPTKNSKASEYHITVGIRAASGTQTWAVPARSPEEALRRYQAGDCAITESEVEVTDLEDATLADVAKVG
jgi:hypothetical protein